MQVLVSFMVTAAIHAKGKIQTCNHLFPLFKLGTYLNQKKGQNDKNIQN